MWTGDTSPATTTPLKIPPHPEVHNGILQSKICCGSAVHAAGTD